MSAVRPAPAIEAAPPITPNLVREIPGARDIGRNTLETLLFRGLSTPVALLLVVVQGRFLHPSGRGAFVLAVLGVTILSRLLGQLGAAVTSRLREGDAELQGLVQRALAVGAVLGTFGMGVVVAWAYASGDVGVRLAGIAALALVPNLVWQTISGVLLGRARVRLWNYIQLLPPILTLAGMLVLVVILDAGVRGAVAAWAIANALTAAFALGAGRDLWHPFGLPHVADRHARLLVRLALLMGVVQVVNLISYRIELYVLRRYEGLDEVGLYSIAMQAAEAMWLIPAAVATALTAPALHETEARAASLVARGAGRGTLFTAAVAVLVGALAPFVIPLIFGDAFEDAATPLLLLLPGIVVYAPVSLVVTTALALVLIPRFGSEGAAVASTLGYACGSLLAWFFFVRMARTAGRASGTG